LNGGFGIPKKHKGKENMPLLSLEGDSKCEASTILKSCALKLALDDFRTTRANSKYHWRLINILFLDLHTVENRVCG
jgi:hypothetical protein